MTKKRKILKVDDVVEIIKLNKEWLEIDNSAEELLGEIGVVEKKLRIPEIGTRYQIAVYIKNLEGRKVIRRLWLPTEWLKIL